MSFPSLDILMDCRLRSTSLITCAGEGGNEGSYEMEEQVSTLQAEPRGSTHQDERAAHQEDSGQDGRSEDGRSEERFNAVASTAASDGRKRAQHCEADPQPSRCCCPSWCSRIDQARHDIYRL